MIEGVFIAGTDTEIGKTTIACLLLQEIRRRGFSAVGMKPVAAGTATDGTGGRVNDDVLALVDASVPRPEPADCNPWLLDDPTSPDIAARRAGVVITLEPIVQSFETLRGAADVVIVEGIGGWRVPLSETLQTVDVVRALHLPVVLVCGLKLGCISHALLSAESIVADGMTLLGWIGNVVDPDYAYLEDSVATIAARLPAPLIGVNPWREPGRMAIIEPDLRTGLDALWPPVRSNP